MYTDITCVSVGDWLLVFIHEYTSLPFDPSLNLPLRTVIKRRTPDGLWMSDRILSYRSPSDFRLFSLMSVVRDPDSSGLSSRRDKNRKGCTLADPS